MDPISREPSPSYLPIAGLIAGLVGLLLGVIALVNASKANRVATAAQAAQAEQVERIDGAINSAERAGNNFGVLKSSTQDGFNLIASELAKINGEVTKLQEVATRSAAAPAASPGAAAARPAGPVVAAPGEYIVKGGDTGFKIANANGVSVANLQAVNPGVSWTGLKVGQKIKLPKK